MVRELVQITHSKPNAVTQAALRLSKTGKGSGPVRKIAHGLYRYAPDKEEDSLRALAQSGNWKAENMVFVTKGAQGGVLSLSNPALDPEKEPESDNQNSSIPVPHGPPCPWTLPTGQLVTWVDYQNGTEEIRISAKGAPPLNPDAVLMILRTLRDYMTDGQIWNCVSLELNIDSITHRLDYSYSLEIIEGLFLKAYQHGYNARIEIIDRRKVSLREVTELFQALSGGLNGLEALKEVHEVKERLVRCEKKASLAYTTAAKIRDGPDRDTDISHNQKKQTVRKEQAPIFR